MPVLVACIEATKHDKLVCVCRPVWVFVLMLLASVVSAQPKDSVIEYFQKEFRYEYYHILLQQTLDVTQAEYGKTIARPNRSDAEELAEARGVYLLMQKRIDVVFLSTSREREEKFLTVRVPLEKGLLGLRLLLIKKSAQPEFDRIKNEAQLRDEMMVGFNPQWSDYPVYENNGYEILSTSKYETLFKMLMSGRFDFFPRGLNEIWAEVERFSLIYPDLTIEKRFAFYYDFPVYFFVHKDNVQLAQRLELGLKRLQENGTFDALFQRHFGAYIAQAKLGERHIMVLQNPERPLNSSLIKPSWWPAATPFPGQSDTPR